MLLCSNAVASPNEPVCELMEASNVDFKVKNANTHTHTQTLPPLRGAKRRFAASAEPTLIGAGGHQPSVRQGRGGFHCQKSGSGHLFGNIFSSLPPSHICPHPRGKLEVTGVNSVSVCPAAPNKVAITSVPGQTWSND